MKAPQHADAQTVSPARLQGQLRSFASWHAGYSPRLRYCAGRPSGVLAIKPLEQAGPLANEPFQGERNYEQCEQCGRVPEIGLGLAGDFEVPGTE